MIFQLQIITISTKMLQLYFNMPVPISCFQNTQTVIMHKHISVWDLNFSKHEYCGLQVCDNAKSDR